MGQKTQQPLPSTSKGGSAGKKNKNLKNQQEPIKRKNKSAAASQGESPSLSPGTKVLKKRKRTPGLISPSPTSSTFTLNSENEDCLSMYSVDNQIETFESNIVNNKAKSQNQNINKSNEILDVNIDIKTTKKPPPIVIVNLKENIKSFLGKIKNLCKDEIGIKCTATRDSEKIYIKTSTVLDHKNILEYLKHSKIEFYTYGLREDLPIKVVLKGLHSSITSEDINEEMTDLGYKPMEIIQLKKKGTSILIPIFIIKFSPLTELKNIFNIKSLCFTKIKWEKYKNSRPAYQCFRCQAFGHIFINCNVSEKCVKCAGNHKSEVCKATRLICANCNQEHLASDQNCPARVKYLENIKKARESKTDSNPPPNTEQNFPKLMSKDVPLETKQTESNHWLKTNASAKKENIETSQQNNINSYQKQYEQNDITNNINIFQLFQQIITLVIKLIEAKDANERNRILREDGGQFSPGHGSSAI